VHSAGTQPGEKINALSAQVLAELGVDITGETPKPIDPDLLRTVDIVVTLAATPPSTCPTASRCRTGTPTNPPNAASTASSACAWFGTTSHPCRSPRQAARLSPILRPLVDPLPHYRSGHTGRTRVADGSAHEDAEAHVDRNDIVEELRRVRADFHELVSTTTPEGLRRRSNGTRWTNRQLLFHMVFGDVIVRALLPLVHFFGRLGYSRGFAATLDAGHRPFHLINYLGSCGGGQLLTTRGQAALLDRTIDVLQRKLAAETDESLARSMHFPTAWDPYFKPTMNVLDVYHFATQHYDHHRRQLGLIVQ
jgi:hypothetical protein